MNTFTIAQLDRRKNQVLKVVKVKHVPEDDFIVGKNPLLNKHTLVIFLHG